MVVMTKEQILVTFGYIYLVLEKVEALGLQSPPPALNKYKAANFKKALRTTQHQFGPQETVTLLQAGAKRRQAKRMLNAKRATQNEENSVEEVKVEESADVAMDDEISSELDEQGKAQWEAEKLKAEAAFCTYVNEMGLCAVKEATRAGLGDEEQKGIFDEDYADAAAPAAFLKMVFGSILNTAGRGTVLAHLGKAQWEAETAFANFIVNPKDLAALRTVVIDNDMMVIDPKDLAASPSTNESHAQFCKWYGTTTPGNRTQIQKFIEKLKVRAAYENCQEKITLWFMKSKKLSKAKTAWNGQHETPLLDQQLAENEKQGNGYDALLGRLLERARSLQDRDLIADIEWQKEMLQCMTREQQQQQQPSQQPGLSK